MPIYQLNHNVFAFKVANKYDINSLDNSLFSVWFDYRFCISEGQLDDQEEELNPYLSNGLVRPYHLDVSISNVSGIKSTFSFYFSYIFLLANSEDPDQTRSRSTLFAYVPKMRWLMHLETGLKFIFYNMFKCDKTLIT